MVSIPNISPTTIDRLRLLRNNVLDLDIAIDDVDAELAPRLQERAQLVACLDEARAELAHLLGRRVA